MPASLVARLSALISKLLLDPISGSQNGCAARTKPRSLDLGGQKINYPHLQILIFYNITFCPASQQNLRALSRGVGQKK
jgi:hypothetical protein